MGQRGKSAKTKWRVKCLCGWVGYRVSYNFNKMCPVCKRSGDIKKLEYNK